MMIVMTAPITPVVITSTAVSAGRPPMLSLIAIAMPAVTDFGASDTTVARGTPNSIAMPVAETMAVNDPATSWFDLPLKSGATIRLDGLPQLVTTRGGAYTFLPSLSAIRFLGSLAN